MRATYIHAPGDIRLDEVPDPTIEQPTDAIVRVIATCVCGSDLWPYRGKNDIDAPQPIGHEHVGEVVEVGSQVQDIKVGDFVIAPFAISDGTCVHCAHGVHTSCANGGFWGSITTGAQGEYTRVPFADGTLVATPEKPDADSIPDLLTLSDVFLTGWHCAVSAGVTKGSRVAVVGDGAVGLSAVLAAKLLGAEQVIAMSRHEPRQAVAKEFGATDIVAERDDEGIERVKELTSGVGVDFALECVGLNGSMRQAFGAARPGGSVGFVGVPHGVELSVGHLFATNKSLSGGVAPVRRYIPEMLPRVLSGEFHPGKVFDAEVSLTEIAKGYQLMDQREAIKTLVRP